MTVRIEVEGKWGTWEPAPGDASGWSRRAARKAVALLVSEQTLGMGVGVRLVDEGTGAVVERARTHEIAAAIAEGRTGTGESEWR